MGKKLSDHDKATLEQLHPVQQVLRMLVTAFVQVAPQAMPAVARALRDSTANDGLSAVAGVMIWDLADGIDMKTGVDTEHGPAPAGPPAML